MQNDLVYSHSFFAQNQVSIYALYVEETGAQRCFLGQCSGPESREYYLLLQVLAGNGHIVIGKHSYSVSMNDVILFYPGDHVSFLSDGEVPLEYAWVGFKGGDAQMLLAQTDFSRQRPLIHFAGDKPFSQNLLALYNCHGYHAPDSVNMTAYLYLFFGELMQGSRSKRLKSDSVQSLLEAAIDYITQNYHEPLTLTQLADAVNASSSWLYRSFIRYMQISPMRYLCEYRIERSLYLLQDNSMSISSVAYAVGFHDPFYFSKVFKSVKNCSPTVYRQQNVTDD